MFADTKARLKLVNQLADGAIMTSLGGSANSSQARKYIKIGASSILAGGVTASLGTLVAIAKPASLVAISIPIAGKVIAYAGAGMFFYGLYKGFQEAWNEETPEEQAVKRILKNTPINFNKQSIDFE